MGFSGGVDSCASASILREQGFDVTLLTLETTSDTNLNIAAVEAASRLGMNLRIADVKELFRKSIIEYFIEGYMSGMTPAPCTLCNPLVKWRILYDIAKAERYDYIATGHYFRICKRNGYLYVRKAVDSLKDQSYYLWGLPQEYLHLALAPMGEMLKNDVKNLYPEYAKRKESMGVCFLNGHSYTDFFRANHISVSKGEIVDITGKVVGTHGGYPLYTIGQKRGLNSSVEGCVIEIDAARNRLIIGHDEDLYHENLSVGDFNVPNMSRLLSSDKLQVKIRGIGRNPQGYAHVEYTNDENLTVRLEQPAWACAKGQPVVFYEEDLVLGGGILKNYW